MKRLLFLILSVIAFSFAACNDDDDNGNSENTTTVTFEEASLETSSSVYSNILWGKKYAGDADNATYSGPIYTEGGATFNTEYTSSGGFDVWSGFAISSNIDTTSEGGLETQFNVYASSASKFAVAFMPMEYDGVTYGVTPEITFDKLVKPVSARFANNTYAYKEIINVATADESIYYTVIATGYNASGVETGQMSLEFVKDGKVVDDWRLIYLDELGDSIKSIKFSYDSNYTNDYGIAMPLYFCLDDLMFETIQ